VEDFCDRKSSLILTMDHADRQNTVKGCPIICAAPILLPIAWALANTGQSDVVVFVACLLSVLPLAGGLAFATEEVALRLGEAWGGLLNATFG
jgi:Ca2+:H+ antiporter